MRAPRTVIGVVALALLGVSIAASAQAPPPVAARRSAPTAPAAAPVWVVDKAASRLTFRASAGTVAFDGVFKTWDAQIAFDPRNLKASRAMVTVTMASAVTGDPSRDQKLPAADWLDVARFAKATFETTAITQAGPGRYLASGTLTLHGIKRPVSLPFILKTVRDVAQVEGSVQLNGPDFGVGKGQAGGAEKVSPQVTVNIKLTARKAH